MELINDNIHMKKIVKQEKISFYVNHEETLDNQEQGIKSIICHKEKVVMDNVQINDNEIVVNGNVNYGLLYYGVDDNAIVSILKDIPFEEILKINGINENLDVNVQICLGDISVKQVDSSSFVYKIQINGYITVESLEDLEITCDIKDGEDEKETIMKRYEEFPNLSIVLDSIENFKIRENIYVPQSKPPIEKIIWQDVRIKNANAKLVTGGIELKGELYVYIMYNSDDENMPVQWMETSVNFASFIGKEEVTEDMVEYINVILKHSNIETEMDQDNEVRILNISALLDLNMKIYKEDEINVLEDVYCPKKNLIPELEEKTYTKLLVKNASRTKEIIKMKVDSKKGGILQICESSAGVKISSISVIDNGLKINGKIQAELMYISGNDLNPVAVTSKEMDFEHRIDAEGITNSDQYYINWRVEQVVGNMIGTDEIEVKAVILLEAIVFREEKQKFIKNIKDEVLDENAYNDSPILMGYIVQSRDTLWNLAKENYTTVENIMKLNDLKSDKIKKGDRLLIMKSC